LPLPPNDLGLMRQSIARTEAQFNTLPYPFEPNEAVLGNVKGYLEFKAHGIT
jgi:hypothetical protein